MMSSTVREFLPVDRQLFDLGVGEALGLIARQKYPSAKHLARAWSIEISTAENVLKGHCSARTLTKAFNAEGWTIIAALGATITGETFEEYEERRFSQIIQDAERARQNIRSLAARRAQMEQDAARLRDAGNLETAGEDRSVARRGRRVAGGRGPVTDQPVPKGAR